MSRVLVLTYKDGLLARLAHDLQIDCGELDVERRGTEIVGRFALASLRVDGAVQHGRVAHGVLSESDRRKILETMTTEVLEVRRFPEATLNGTIAASASGFTITGTLELHGRTVSLPPVAVTKRGDAWVAEVVLVPSRWGIAPYRALAGALKLQDRVTVRIELDADRGADGDARWTLGRSVG
jgi:hypothetical protein